MMLLLIPAKLTAARPTYPARLGVRLVPTQGIIAHVGVGSTR
jgi:hypothetical protein